MSSLISWRNRYATVALGALLACALASPGIAQSSNGPSSTPPASSHNDAQPPGEQDATSKSPPSSTDAPAIAPLPGCRLQNDKKLDLIV